MKEALFYTRHQDFVKCTLCPHNCRLNEGKTGNCQVRKNIGGKLIAENYGITCSIHADPIEKKPLYQFYPGTNILSVGSIGCNLRCNFCQNWEISQRGINGLDGLSKNDPSEIAAQAAGYPNNIGVAYTYNEPIVWFEFMVEIAGLIRKNGLKNVMVTNGFINPEPLNELLGVIDAFSVDLKAFTDSFYIKQTASHLDPVLQTLKTIRKNGKHLEITNLIIPNQNDNEKDFRNMVRWIKDNLGKETILHLSRYFPIYKMAEPPTTERLLNRFFEIASQDLDYVYLGNMRTSKGQNTYCSSCKTLAIERSGYRTEIINLDRNGRCNQCGEQIIIDI